MKKVMSYIILVSFISLFLSCEEEMKEAEKLQPEGFVELVEAYEAGKVFSSSKHASGACALSFDDGTVLNIAETAFRIHDCTSSNPSVVSRNGGWWCVGGVTFPIEVLDGVPASQSFPVYVYFDSMTLYVHASNGEILKFPSVAMKEQDEQEKENAKLQNIPVVRITTAGGAGIYDKKNYVDGTITITDPEKMYSDVTEFTADMGIRGRGNSTWGWPKKPWKVKLDEKASLLGMPADKEWALLANYSDRTLLRNIVAMKLSEICGFSWTPRMRSVEVYLNDKYQGVYTLCEHKKVSKDRVNIDVAGENDNDAEAVTGGYYLEIEENQDETTCWWTGMEVPMMFSDPEEPTPAQYVYVTGLFEEFEQVLQSSSFADPSEGYHAYIDVDSFIDFYIVQELTKNIDGNMRKSSFITIERGGKMEMYHLWDFDLTLGNCGYFDGRVGNGPEGFWIRDFNSKGVYGKGWFHRLFEDPAFIDAVQKRWNELMPEFEKIPEFIDDQAFRLEPARKRNFEKWNINESVDWVNFPSLGSYEKELEYLKDFYSDRLEWLDTELNRL
ncbi:MAG: CotH kinase family protein [Bacteroidales bacterium]|nr:CotH kinase family protein [Bacteroidales bacterium]MBQ8856473.1 CotH kinase family protein [Bacteroidales bacterium]